MSHERKSRLSLLVAPSAFLCFGHAVFIESAGSAAAKPKPADTPARPAPAKTYTSRGTVIGVRGTVLLLKDKGGTEWEYVLPAGTDGKPLVGKNIKVTHTLQATAIEPEPQ